MKAVNGFLLGSVLLAVFFAGIRVGKGRGMMAEKSVCRADTVVRRDTIVEVIEKPVDRYIVRHDTVCVYIHDSVEVPVYLPIERREYRTDRYHAVIEGYHPELISLATYPETKYITRTESRTVARGKRFGIGIQAGYGISKQGFTPYIGIGMQYRLIAF